VYYRPREASLPGHPNYTRKSDKQQANTYAREGELLPSNLELLVAEPSDLTLIRAAAIILALSLPIESGR
jgi:hypothetical protein